MLIGTRATNVFGLDVWVGKGHTNELSDNLVQQDAAEVGSRLDSAARSRISKEVLDTN
jgi:hypothetical protein